MGCCQAPHGHTHEQVFDPKAGRPPKDVKALGACSGLRQGADAELIEEPPSRNGAAGGSSVVISTNHQQESPRSSSSGSPRGSKGGVAPPAGTSAAPPRPQQPQAPTAGEVWNIGASGGGGPRQGSALRPGSAVLIRGMTDKRHLNGQEAVCVKLDSLGAAWQVRLAGGDATLHLIRPENLKELPPSAASVPAYPLASVAPAPEPYRADGNDPPLLAAKSANAASSPKAQATARLLERERNRSRQQQPAGSLAFFANARYSNPLDTENSPDAELLSMVEDEQVELSLLDDDMQLTTLGYGGRNLRP